MTDSDETRDPADPIAEILRDVGPRQALPAYDLESLSAPALAAWERKLARKAARRRRFALAALMALVIGAGVFWRSGRPAEPAAVVLASSGAQGTDYPVGAELFAGQTVVTTEEQWITVEMRGKHRLRLDARSTLDLISSEQVDLRSGAVYVEAKKGPLVIQALGTVTEHVGTLYEVRVDEGSAIVRVREGRVRVRRGERVVEIERGRQVRSSDSGEPVVEDSPPFGESWAWIHRSAPEFQGKDLQSFLEWVEGETGREVEAAPELIYKPSGEPYSIVGSTEGMGLEDALEFVLEASGLAHELEGERILVTSAVEP